MQTRWLILLITQPTGNAALRMRIWREMKARGAAALRDGVHLLPDSDNARSAFDLLGDAVRQSGGSAHVVQVLGDGRQDVDWRAMFDRAEQYSALLLRAQQLQRGIASADPEPLRRQVRRLEDELAALIAVDFFPGPAQQQLTQTLSDLRVAVERAVAPDEPRAANRLPARLPREQYVGRVWATRQHLWIDRVASAWLIRRFIDPQARFVWVKRPGAKPARAIGFDFDGAEFTHLDGRVTFEVLVASFDLGGDAALARLGAIVHALDAGGASLPEVSGFEVLMTGLRALHPDDDGFLAAATGMLDAFYAALSADAAAINGQGRSRRERTAR